MTYDNAHQPDDMHLRRLIREEVEALIEDKIPTIVRRETDDMRDTLFAQAARTQEIQLDVYYVKKSVRTNSGGINRIDALLEDLNSRIAGIQEAY